jgi:hypothetical protein
MTKLTRTEVNCETGETSIIELTDAETAEFEAAKAKAEAEQAAGEALKAQAQADKEAIAAKLGLTSEELAKLFA